MPLFVLVFFGDSYFLSKIPIEAPAGPELRNFKPTDLVLFDRETPSAGEDASLFPLSCGFNLLCFLNLGDPKLGDLLHISFLSHSEQEISI